MTYDRETARVRNRLQTAWNGILIALKQMEPIIQVKPNDITSIFNPVAESGDLTFSVGPVVFRVPERAERANRPPNLFIVVSGWICFAPSSPSESKQTTRSFGTKVGYFRSKDGVLSHVYGAHYDMDETLLGHPVFHGQVCSQESLTTAICDHFREPFQVGDDHTKGLLRNVRTPTAQMDAFSVITQIGADHLLTNLSNSEVQRAFAKLREACDFLVGAAGRLSYLNSDSAVRCYRSTHWYEREPEPQAAPLPA